MRATARRSTPGPWWGGGVFTLVGCAVSCCARGRGDPDFTALAISVALAAAGAVTPIAGLVAPGWTAVAGVLSAGVSLYF